VGNLFGNGNVLLLPAEILLFYHPRTTNCKRLSNRGVIQSIQDIVHKPTLASLKDIAKGGC